MQTVQSFYQVVTRKFAAFDGRASRREFWQFVVAYLVVSLVLGVVGVAAILGFRKFPSLAVIWTILSLGCGACQLAIGVPILAVQVRRLHDIDRSGWWLFVGMIPFLGPLLLFVFWGLDSQPGSNQYGPNPSN